MVTIKDVAREAGVAISTVSNVFNNGDIVSEETKQKVLEAVEKLHYIPNMNAKLLKSNRKNTGLFITVTPFLFIFLFNQIQISYKRLCQ